MPPAAPKVSVIIPTYNRAVLLPRAVESVLAQTCQDFEILIVDDGSADHTPAVIAGFADPRIRSFRHHSNRGQSAAVNTGIANARAEYCAFLDDDDEFTPSSLADRLTVFESAPSEVALVYGWRDLVNDATEEVTPGGRVAVEGVEAVEYAFEVKNIASTSTLLVRTSAAKEIGGFDERLKVENDSFFIYNIILKHPIAALRKVIIRYHEHHGSPRSADSTAERKESTDAYYAIYVQTFSQELEERPRVYSSLLRKRAVYTMETRRVADAMRFTLAAFKRRPLTTANVRHALRLARVFIFYATPLRRYRERLKGVRRRLGLRKE